MRLPAMFSGERLWACCRSCGMVVPAATAVVSERGFTYCRAVCAYLDAKYQDEAVALGKSWAQGG